VAGNGAVDNGVAGGTIHDIPGYPYARVLQEFKIAAIDFMRWLVSARLDGFTPEKLKKAQEQSPPDVNRGIWSRSVPRLRWSWELTEKFLDEDLFAGVEL